MYGCQQILVTQDRDLINILEFLCSEAHKLTNMGIYYARQLYFKAKRGIGKFDLDKSYKTNNHYRVLYSQAAQRILLYLLSSAINYWEFSNINLAFIFLIACQIGITKKLIYDNIQTM